MAQKAKKELAKSNTATLNNVHIATLVIHLLFWLSHTLFRSRSLIPYIVLSIPALICEYILESTGRPKYDAATKQLKTSGEDLGAAGLTEYMFDVIMVTWASTVLVIIFGNWGWWIMVAIPAYAVYLGSGLLGLGKQKMAQMQGAEEEESAAPKGNRRSRRAA